MKLPEYAVEKVELFVKKYMDTFTNKPYHNFGHAQTVRQDAELLANKTGVTDYETEQLINAALLHDVISKPPTGDAYLSQDRGERASAEVAKSILPVVGYDNKFIQGVTDLILATEFGVPAKNQLQGIIQDADLSNLGQEDFWVCNEQFRREVEIDDGEPVSDAQWWSNTLKLLHNHEWNTQKAQALWGDKHQENLDRVKEKWHEYNNGSIEEFLSS